MMQADRREAWAYVIRIQSPKTRLRNHLASMGSCYATLLPNTVG